MWLTTHRMKEEIIHGKTENRVAVAEHLLTSLQAHLPWLAARELTGVNIKRREEDWILVLKARRKTKHQVCFFTGDSIEDCLVNMAHGLLWDLATWKEDKWTTMRSDKTGTT